MASRSHIIPSPNEVEMLMQEQMKHRRKMRILQVRQQGQKIAKDIRDNVQQRKHNVLQDIASKLNQQHISNKQQNYMQTKEDYSKGLSDVGTAHDSATENCVDQALCEAMFEEQKKIAKKRFCDAINQLHAIRSAEEEMEMAGINRRKLVTRKEKVRAKRIAMLPKPESSSSDLDTPQYSGTSIGTIMSTQSCIPVVERATLPETNAYEDAKVAAQHEEERREEERRKQTSSELAQRERAQFRHLAALQQARMQNEYINLENDLKALQKKDALKRKSTVSCAATTPSLDISLQDLMM